MIETEPVNRGNPRNGVSGTPAFLSGAIQKRVLELAIQDKPLPEMLAALVEAVEAESVSGMIGSILLLDSDGVHLRHGAGPSLPGAYNEAIDGVEIGPGVGSCGTAAHTGEPVYVSDIDTDPLWVDFRDLALSHGLRACWSTPIVSGKGEVLGTFAMYYRAPREPEPVDLELVEFVTRSASLIVERSRAAEALRESEARFRNMADHAPVMMWVTDPEGYCTYLNRAWYQFTGQTEAEAEGFGWLDATHPDDKAEAERIFLVANERREPFRIEYRLRRADGEYCWAIDAASPRWGADGAFLGYIGSVIEIDDRKRMEDALAAREAHLAALVSQTAAGFAETDLTGRFASVNGRYCQIAGRSREELLTLTMQDITHPEDLPRNLARFERMIATGESFEIEKRYLKPDGTAAWVNNNVSFIRSADGASNTVLAVSIDVTDRKAAEAALRELNATLEQRVAEATEELRASEAALRQSQKMEAIGNLTGGVAHDFNNLLQVVSGNLQMLSRDVAGNERAERRVQSALAGVSRGAKLAAQLLAFGRRQPLAPKVINVGRLITGLDEMLRRTLGEEIEVETTIADGLWNTLADPGQIENALLNLAINARDAMGGHGKLTIEVCNAVLDDEYVRANEEVDPGQYVMIAVTDTGSGIPPEIVDKVFEPFFSTKPEGRGTGLGLSMVYGFVKQSGGHVKIYSEVGHGTAIKLYLPRSTQSEDVTVTADEAPVAGGAETILVVEDDEEVRATVVETLGDLGYRVLEAPEASSALAILEGGATVDLLFTDVVMPGSLRSPELARKAQERLPSIEVLFTSGYTENAIVHGGRLDEGVNLISKPYSREALARKIRQVLANKPQGPSTAAANDEATQRLTILLVEDDALIRMNTAEMLQDLGHDVVEAGSAESAIARLGASAVDVLVTDLALPGMSGADLAERVRLVRPGVSVVFATGHDRPRDWAFEADGPDPIWLRKPYNAAELAASIERAMSSEVVA